MKRSFRFLAFLLLMLVTVQRSPAPIVEEKTTTPAPASEDQTTKRLPKPKRLTQPKVNPATTSSGAARSPTPAPSKRFAGIWTGVMQTFPWGDISQTITVNATETTITMVSTGGPESGKLRTVKAERNGDTLKGNFGNWGLYSLTPLADGATALVRLQAPFNDNTASYHRTTSIPR